MRHLRKRAMQLEEAAYTKVMRQKYMWKIPFGRKMFKEREEQYEMKPEK